MTTAATSREPSDRLLHASIAVAGIVFITALVWAHMDLLADSFWYVASGRSVLDGQGFPKVDPFAFSSVRTPWIVHMPGSVVLFAWLDRVFGLRAILVVAALVEAAALSLLWLGRRASLTARLATLPLIAFAIVLQREDLCARGQVFGDLFFVVLLLALDRMRTRRLPPWTALILGALWVNLHSSFVLAVLVPLLFAGAIALDRLLESAHGAEATNAPTSVRPYLLFAAFAGAGALINPYGPALVVDVLSLAGHPTTFRQKLFVSPEFLRWDTLLTFTQAAGVTAMRLAFGPRRHLRADLLLLAAFIGFAASGMRYLPHLAYVSIFFFTASASDGLARSGLASQLAALSTTTKRVATGGLVVAALAFATTRLRETKDPFAHVPREAAELVRSQHLPTNVLNDYHWGGFLLYAWMGTPRVFIDGRSYLYFNGVFEDQETLADVKPGARELLEVYGFRTALLERGSRLALAIESLPEWRKVHEDRLAVVLVRVR